MDTRSKVPGVVHGLRPMGKGSTPPAPPWRRTGVTTLQASRDVTDWSFAPPRFEPGLSTTHGGFTTGDLGASPDRTRTGWLSSADHLVTSSRLEPPCCHGVQAAGRTPTTPGAGRLWIAWDCARWWRSRHGVPIGYVWLIDGLAMDERCHCSDGKCQTEETDRHCLADTHTFPRYCLEVRIRHACSRPIHFSAYISVPLN